MDEAEYTCAFLRRFGENLMDRANAAELEGHAFELICYTTHVCYAMADTISSLEAEGLDAED